MAAVAQHGQQTLQEAQRAEVVQVALHAGVAPGGRGDVRLPAEPGREPVGRCVVAGGVGAAVAAQRAGKAGSAAGDLGQPLLQQFTDRRVQPAGVVFGYGTVASTSSSSAKIQPSRTGRSALG